MLKHLVRLALILMMVSLACSLPVQTADPATSVPKVISNLLVSAGINSTPTPTPFQPLGPTQRPSITPTITVTPTRTTTLTTTPTVTSTFLGDPNLPTPVHITQPMPEGVVNFMVLGSDYRPSSGFRTDIIILISVNTKKGTVSAVSFPRDLYVPIIGWQTDRINTVQQHGGFSMLQDTMEYNFGVRPQYYIMTNFQGFEGIVNSLGGIDVNVSQYLSDTCDLPWGSGGWCSISAGVHKMDGQTALWYVRSRHSTSDFERGRRAQEVMLALFTKLMSLDAVSRLPDLYSNYISSVETNMTLKDMATLLPIAPQILADRSRIHQYRVIPPSVTGYITPGGADVQLPNYAAIKTILEQAIFGQ